MLFYCLCPNQFQRILKSKSRLQETIRQSKTNLYLEVSVNGADASELHQGGEDSDEAENDEGVQGCGVADLRPGLASEADVDH